MTLRVYNTLARKKEPFVPINPPQVTMYVCGITPYDEAHLGHARAYTTFDVIYRYLEYKGYKVSYIQNVTDIDDKIISRARETGISTQELAKKSTDRFFQVMHELNVKVLPAKHYPHATVHIPDMIKFIADLIKARHAYVVGSDVYFSVRSFKDYGKLSRRKLDDMESGARVAVAEAKRDPLDFALWKAAKEGEPAWDSPWGKGRPGWHIECSTMSMKYLGQPIDIHGGGMDLIFPHHENEIAQAEALSHKPFVKYWIHNGFVTINREKMSKSLGNFFTISDVLKKYSGEVIRFFLLSTHYRSPIDFSDSLLEEAKRSLNRIHIALQLLEERAAQRADAKIHVLEEIKKYQDQFIAAMDDDFNTAEAIAVLFNLVSYANKAAVGGSSAVKLRELILELGGLLGLTFTRSSAIPANIQELLDKYQAARQAKDFAFADKIRDEEFKKMGYALSNTVDGGLRVRRI